jgi:hypothetical protein
MGEINTHPDLIYIGHVAVLYLPTAKLDDPRYGALNQTARGLLHQFIIDNYDAYTHQKSDIRGYWRKSKDGRIIHDANEMYEVSFHGEERVPLFIDFLAALCYLMEEECLYLRMGYKSWLVSPRPSGSSVIRRMLNENSSSPTSTPPSPPTS